MYGHLRLVFVALVALLVTGCQEINTLLSRPEVIVPPGVTSAQTADQVAKRMLDEIAANERKLGRALAPARIVKIQLLQMGEMLPLRHFDGTNPGGGAMGPSQGPGWMVEAVGTFLDFDRRNPEVLAAMGTHGFREYDDKGGDGLAFIACWTLNPVPPAQLEGTCR
jgi:hypothetical protein